MRCPGKLSGIVEDTLELHDLAVDLADFAEEEGVPLEDTRRYAAFGQFYDAAKRLAGTSLAELKEEGLETCLADGEVLMPIQGRFHVVERMGGMDCVLFLSLPMLVACTVI
jgi:hypothetical protein